MHTFVLQDWIHVRGGTGVPTVTQAEHDWLDLEHYQDVTFWVSCNEVAGGTTLSLQTSPTADDTLFTNLFSALTLSAGSTPTVAQALMLTASVPLARFVRWQLNGTPTWEANFRVIVAANAPGM